MGYPDNDIDQLIERGELSALLAQLKGYIGASDETGPPVSLVPQAERPDGQLQNLLAVTRLYGKFATGEDPNAHDPEADDIDDGSTSIPRGRRVPLRCPFAPAICTTP
jgi:hypothetical protein